MADVRRALLDRGLQPGDIVEPNQGPGINAEMVADMQAAWYLIETVPGHERVAAAHLVGRRFMIFVPDMRYEPLRRRDPKDGKWKFERGEKLDRLQRMFVGYIFVFCWLDDANYHRIQAIPGVRRLVCWPEGNIATFTDRQIDELRSLEIILNPLELPPDWRKTRKRHGWQKTRHAENWHVEDEKVLSAVGGFVHIGDGQWIDTIEALRVLDGRDANQAIAKALGLAS
jgi:transcription antitermination factor NusG